MALKKQTSKQHKRLIIVVFLISWAIFLVLPFMGLSRLAYSASVAAILTFDWFLGQQL